MNILNILIDLFYRLIDKLATISAESNRAQKIYFFSIALFFTTLYLFPRGPIQQGGILLSMLGFLIGYLPTLIAFSKKLWQFRIGKMAVIIINTVILYIAQLVAKQIISESLGLPPYDFSGTLVWLTFANVVIIWMLFSMPLSALPLPYFMVSIFRSKRKFTQLECFGHYAGAILLILIIQNTLGILTITLLNFPIIRTSAYYLDYFDGYRLIKLESSEKIMIHANETISIAKKEANGVISIRAIKLNDPNKGASLYPWSLN